MSDPLLECLRRTEAVLAEFQGMSELESQRLKRSTPELWAKLRALSDTWGEVV